MKLTNKLIVEALKNGQYIKRQKWAEMKVRANESGLLEIWIPITSKWIDMSTSIGDIEVDDWEVYYNG